MKSENLIDKVVSYISPKAGAERTRSRIINERLRKYEAASHSKRNQGWISSNTDSNGEILPYISTLRNRSRDLVRNNPYAERAVRSISGFVVGSGIIPQIKTNIDSKKNQAIMVDKILKDWADTSAIDLEGVQNLYGIQDVTMRGVIESGGALILRRRRKPNSGLPLPVQIQALEIDHLDMSYNDNLSNGSYIRFGIEISAIGEIVAYHILQEHPGQTIMTSSRKRDRWLAKDVICPLRIDRAGQRIGVPWAAPVMVRMKNFDEYEDAQLMRQKIAACFAAFVTNLEGDDDEEEDFEDSQINPGLIKKLPTGTDIKFGSPPAVIGYGEYSSVSLHSIAVGLGVPYELLTSDLSQVNFTSGRMGMIPFYKNVGQWTNQIMIQQVCSKIQTWFFEACSLAGVDTSGLFMTWTPPKKEMVDPVKETTATIKQIRGGLKTLSRAIEEQGEDPEDHFKEYEKDNKRIDDLKLTLDTDPRKTAAQGNLHSPGDS